MQVVPSRYQSGNAFNFGRWKAFLKEKRIMLRGLGHPQNLQLDSEFGIPRISIWLRVFGLLPVSAINLFKLLSNKSYVLLYPGGAREALHRKGEVHKLFWPEQQEFVRMAAKCGATIVPFGSVGEDDVSEAVCDDHPTALADGSKVNYHYCCPVFELFKNFKFQTIMKTIPSLRDKPLKGIGIGIGSGSGSGRGIEEHMSALRPQKEENMMTLGVRSWGTKMWRTLSRSVPATNELVMIMDYNDQMNIPALNNHLQELIEKSFLLRKGRLVANQQLHLSLVMPKVPGRFYYLFGKPIKTKRMEKILNDKDISQALYAQIKHVVEKNIAYLIKKRDEDPYRGFVKRVVFQAKSSTPWDKVPTFDP
ncbi:hypothetical protein L1987_06925 [Smallanthus sonchifolius]|uniref:Uncharacterized protein n=1 Tax=Smallanthus sonchifolius TaxID=185202 RepID=A0ACB9JZP0_9ASTR|nr:hypothetical protein L1987_06925 [Smallanthus sonchifolius]